MIEQSDSFLGRALSRFLGGRSGLDRDEKEVFERMVKDLVQAMRDGHTCIYLDEKQKHIVQNCRLVSAAGDLPLVLFGSKLYLSRYFKYEKNLARKLREQAENVFSVGDIEVLLDLCFSAPENEKDWQREAAKVALSRGVCIISGGPGTGKTTTIVKIAGLLLACHSSSLRIALAAPTGKAAMRLRESVAGQTAHLPLEDEIKEAIPKDVSTLHRLLGAKRFSPRFRYNRNNLMGWDVVIVDEASMVDLAMMSKLAESLKPGARLILIGDKDQLASVESGAVLSDCISVLKNNVVELKKSYRFDTAISEFAGLINRGEADNVIEMLKDGSVPDVMAADSSWAEDAGQRYGRFMESAQAVREVSELGVLFKRFNEFQVVCAIRYSSRGVRGVNERIEKYLSDQGFECNINGWYAGRPVIVERNDYNLGLFNGDIGICLPDFEDGTLVVWFEQPDGTFRKYLPGRLTTNDTVWAMTIHKSQGSEFDEVLVVLPEEDSLVLCRELLYTAVTRARKRVLILSDEAVLAKTVGRRVERYSGFAEHLNT